LLDLLQQSVNGFATGCIYGLVALGFVLIYKASEIVNFAQGDILMLGAFIGWTAVDVWGIGYWPGLLVAILATAAIGFFIDRQIMRPIIGQPQFAGIMLTIGLAFTIRGGAIMIWGPEERSFQTPFSNKTTNFGGLVVDDGSLSIIVGTLVLCAILFVFFRRTRLGVAMQAASQNQLAAYLMAIPVKTVNSLVWGLSAGVAAAAGMLVAPTLLVDTNLWIVVLKGFAAAVLGGFGSIPGAVVGGMIIGVSEQLVGVYLDPESKGITAYVILLAVLLVWPQGLFGGKEKTRV
jgi:branched-chain amino acid transport system permease protein